MRIWSVLFSMSEGVAIVLFVAMLLLWAAIIGG